MQNFVFKWVLLCIVLGNSFHVGHASSVNPNQEVSTEMTSMLEESQAFEEEHLQIKELILQKTQQIIEICHSTFDPQNPFSNESCSAEVQHMIYEILKASNPDLLEKIEMEDNRQIAQEELLPTPPKKAKKPIPRNKLIAALTGSTIAALGTVFLSALTHIPDDIKAIALGSSAAVLIGTSLTLNQIIPLPDSMPYAANILIKSGVLTLINIPANTLFTWGTDTTLRNGVSFMNAISLRSLVSFVGALTSTICGILFLGQSPKWVTWLGVLSTFLVGAVQITYGYLEARAASSSS